MYLLGNRVRGVEGTRIGRVNPTGNPKVGVPPDTGPPDGEPDPLAPLGGNPVAGPPIRPGDSPTPRATAYRGVGRFVQVRFENFAAAFDPLP